MRGNVVHLELQTGLLAFQPAQLTALVGGDTIFTQLDGTVGFFLAPLCDKIHKVSSLAI